MKKIYNSPAVRFVDLETEGMIADSIKFGGNNERIDTQDAYTQQQDPDMWGNESVWK